MTLYALLFMLQAQPAQAETAPGPMPQVTTSTVDPVGDWLVSEANLKHPDQTALQRAYRDYLVAGGTGTFMDWRRASLKGVNAPLYPTRQRWHGQIFAWDGKTYIRLPASPTSTGRRECVEGRQVQVSEGNDTWFRTLGPDERERLPACSFLRQAR